MNRRRVLSAVAVLLAHAMILYWLALLPALRDRPIQTLDTKPITILLAPRPAPEAATAQSTPAEPRVPAPIEPVSEPPAPAAESSGAITLLPAGRVDWPLE